MGVREKRAPYPVPKKAVIRGKSIGFVESKGEARRTNEMVKKVVVVRRRVRRDMVNCLLGSENMEEDEEEDAGRRTEGMGDVGAKTSESPPRRRRARVDVAANIETFVLAELDDGTEDGGG